MTTVKKDENPREGSIIEQSLWSPTPDAFLVMSALTYIKLIES